VNRDPLRINVKRVGAVEVPLPRYQTPDSAGLDLCAALTEAVRLRPGERHMIPTGLAMAIPLGWEGQVRPRSGLAARHGISIVNSPGTIDADYRGEVKVMLINHGQEVVIIEPLDRIAQLVIQQVPRVELAFVEELDDTHRGVGGYGSTGRS
jgi:dUTP pyrophosphatase